MFQYECFKSLSNEQYLVKIIRLTFFEKEYFTHVASATFDLQY